MLLKNLMEEKQLDFDQPLLSVRRHSPTVTSKRTRNTRIDSYSHQLRHQLPNYKSELKSGPIRDPGAVPFVWEQSPGQPKEDTNPQSRTFQKPPVAPRPPPGRAKQQNTQNVSHNTTKSVSIPCCSENKKQDVVIHCDSRKDSSIDDEGSGDEVFVDALDTLSRAESSFLNWSMSGLSGLEHSDVKPSRSFQDREFVMDRFLPAAKAMACETPHAPKKQMQIEKKPKEGNQNKPSLRYGPSFAKKYAYFHENEEHEESDDEFDDQKPNMRSVCGLLPRFCLLSPIPAMSVRTRVAKSSASKIRPKSSSAGSYTEMESGIIETNSIENAQRSERYDDKAKLRSGSGQIPEIEGVGLQIKGAKTSHEFLDDSRSRVESISRDGVVEKVEAPNLTPVEGFSKFVEEDDDIVKTRSEQMDAIDSPNEDMKKLQSNSLLAPPPLPNSPSDSWLHRTLPLTARKPALLPYLVSATNLECSKAAASGMKWETIVKTTKVQESLTTIPEA